MEEKQTEELIHHNPPKHLLKANFVVKTCNGHYWEVIQCEKEKILINVRGTIIGLGQYDKALNPIDRHMTPPFYITSVYGYADKIGYEFTHSSLGRQLRWDAQTPENLAKKIMRMSKEKDALEKSIQDCLTVLNEKELVREHCEDKE